MFVSSGQFYVFIACVAFGFCGGGVFSIVQPLKKLANFKKVNVFLDFFAFSLLALLFCGFCFRFNFPSLRGYMILGVFCGLYIYFKSFYITIAKITKKMYNIIKVKVKFVAKKIKNFATRNLRKGHLKR